MKLRLLFLIAVLLAVCSIPLDALGWMPTRWQVFEELSDQTLPTPTEDTAVIVFVLLTDAEDITGSVVLRDL